MLGAVLGAFPFTRMVMCLLIPFAQDFPCFKTVIPGSRRLQPGQTQMVGYLYLLTLVNYVQWQLFASSQKQPF